MPIPNNGSGRGGVDDNVVVIDQTELSVTSSPVGKQKEGGALSPPVMKVAYLGENGEEEIVGAGEDEGTCCEEEEIFACDMGSPEDRAFDHIIGVLEKIMVSDGFHRILGKFFKSQPHVKDLDDHQRHSAWKEYLSIVDKYVDEEVQQQLPEHMTLQQVAQLIEVRKNEVSDEVMELVTGGSMEYSAFVALWEVQLTR